MTALSVYDPAQCCSSGVCGPDGVDELAQFAAALDWLKEQGVTVSRYNLGHQPEAFAGNPTVRGTMTSEGIRCLPLIALNGKIMSKGRYPSRAELASMLNLAAEPEPAISVAGQRCCG